MVLKYPALAIGTPEQAWWVPVFIGGIIIGLLLYYIPKIIRRSQGVNTDLVYKELPPE